MRGKEYKVCYYNGVKVTHAEFITLKMLEKAVINYDFLTRPLHNAFDYGKIPVLKRKEDVIDFDVVEMEWGLIPKYVAGREGVEKFRRGYVGPKGFVKGYDCMNAKSENLFIPRSIWTEPALNRRCLILSTGFFEWRHIHRLKRDGTPVKTADKYPYHIQVRDRPYFYMAGIWNPWVDHATGEYVETVALLTTEANHLMRQVHNTKMRMPTILDEDRAWSWLFEDLSEEQVSMLASYQFPSKYMEACTVSKKFREDLEPATEFVYEELPALEVEL